MINICHPTRVMIVLQMQVCREVADDCLSLCKVASAPVLSNVQSFGFSKNEANENKNSKLRMVSTSCTPSRVS